MTDPDTLGPRLELISDDRPGRMVPMKGRVIQIGRDPIVDIRFGDVHVSRLHARVELNADGGYDLVDTSRHQSTYLNGRRILGARPVRLRDGDRIQVGDHEMVFRCESQVLPVDQEAGSSVLQTIGELSSFHLAERSRRPTETLRAVLNVNRSLGGGGEVDEVLGRALGSLMELFPQTECGVIVTADPDGRLPIRAIKRRVGPPPKLTLSRTILHQVLEKGEAVLIRDVATDERFKLHESVAALFRTALCVPLPGTDGKPVGMVQLGAREDGSCRFNSDDLELLAALALPMAVAVENDRLIRERAHWAAARHMQRALLPRHRPEIPGYAFWECYRPALEVGGDFYDYIRVPPRDQVGDPRWVVCVGDVSGKGMPAALIWAAVCPEIRHAVRSGASPADVLTRVNRHVCEMVFDNSFVTMIIGELDPIGHRLTLANAGHELPLIRGVDGQVDRLELPGSGYPLGVVADAVYSHTVIDLEPGDVLVLHTDGLVDSFDRNRQRFGPDRMIQTLSCAPAGASLAGEALLEAVMQHTGPVAAFDDLTIVSLGRETS
jgi:phosphoserine phosphatase RsbU/P